MDKEETRRLLMRELVDKHCSHILAERIGTGAMWIAAPEFGTAIDLVPGQACNVSAHSSLKGGDGIPPHAMLQDEALHHA